MDTKQRAGTTVTDAQGNPTPGDLRIEGAHQEIGGAPGEQQIQNPAVTATEPGATDAGAKTEAQSGETVHVVAITEFWNDGEKRKVGDEFDMPVRRAIDAGRFVRALGPDGKRVSVRSAVGQTEVPRADLAGRPRHERVDALEQEKNGLQERLDAVNKSLEHERAQVKADAKPEPEEKK